MTARVAHRLAQERSTSPCARCRSLVALAAGAWHAAEPEGPDSVVCDRCTQRDDADGYAQLLASRRLRGYCPAASRAAQGGAA